jgi:hypothetical protein
LKIGSSVDGRGMVVGAPGGGAAPGAVFVPPIPISCCAAGNESFPVFAWLWQVLTCPCLRRLYGPDVIEASDPVDGEHTTSKIASPRATDSRCAARCTSGARVFQASNNGKDAVVFA